MAQHDGKAAEALCLACGLCCNGVIFADVKLQSDDNAEELQALGLSLLSPEPGQAHRASPAPLKFRQPCPAYADCQCRIYSDRPHHCRQFECLLFKSVQAGHTTQAQALETIRTARQRAATVRELLRELGDQDEHLALAGRFRRMARRLERSDLDESTADIFGRLTLAVHELNLLLSQAFYR